MSSTDSAEPIPERVVGLVDDVNDPEAKTRIVRVRDLVAFLTNTVGAVHVTERPERLHQLLWEHTRSATYITPDGQYTGPVMALIEVARVTRAALEPLRAEITPEVWPPGLPEFARRVVRRPLPPP
jgi:hypothetical protein